MGSTKYQSTEGRKEKIRTWQAMDNLLIKNTLQRRKVATGIVKDSSRRRKTTKPINRQWKGFCRDQNVKMFKDTTTPNVKYTNRVYKSWDANRNVIRIFKIFSIDF